jgi:hypothetical protein
MTAQETLDFISLVADMRKTQKEYFATRSGTAFNKAKALEWQVDKRLKDLQQQSKGPLPEQTELF